VPPAPQRLKWDGMLHRTELVSAGRGLAAEAEQIVLWHRKYPFAFLRVSARRPSTRAGSPGGACAWCLA
jgi:hypothetical protein